MKFLVDEMPNFYDECSFSKEEWNGEKWISICTLNNEKCNLNNNRYTAECYGLKKLERNETDIDCFDTCIYAKGV